MTQRTLRPPPAIYSRSSFRVLSLLAAAITAFGQPANYPYAVKTLAGSNPLGDGGLATQALLFSPSTVALDGLGNTYILDSSNYRIRKVGLDGTCLSGCFSRPQSVV